MQRNGNTMKLKSVKSKKTKGLYSQSDSESPSPSGVGSWAITDRNKFRELSKVAKTEGRFTPEFWVPDGERRDIAFVDEDAVAAFRVYNVKRNGRFTKVVAPPEGEEDLMAAMGMRSQLMFLFRVIDIEGYVPKKGPNAGKRQRFQPKFYLVGNRMYDQIKLQCVEVSGSRLNSGIVKVVRSGSGRQSVYTFIPKIGGRTPEIRKAILNFPKWQEFYAPPTLSQQRSIVGSVDTDDDGGEE